jgi:hypothetical protein
LWGKATETFSGDTQTDENLIVGSVDRRLSSAAIGVCIHGLAGDMEILRTLSEAGFQVVVFVIAAISSARLDKIRTYGSVIDLRECGRVYVTEEKDAKSSKGLEIYRQCQSKYRGPYPEIFANPFLDFHFQHYIRERWPRFEAYMQNADTLLGTLPLAGFLTSNLTDTENWVLCELMRRRGIPIYIALHSGWPDPVGLFDIAKAVMVWSRTHLEHVDERVRDKVFITGSLQYDKQRSDLGFDRKSVFGNEVKEKGQHVVLVLTTASRTGLYPVIDLEKHLHTLSVLFNIPGDLRDRVHIVVKVKEGHDHPDTYELIREEVGGSGNVSITANIPLQEAVSCCDVAVLVNIPTTAVFEPIFQGKPVVYVNVSTVQFCGQPHIPDGSLDTITNESQIWQVLREILSSKKLQDQVARREWKYQVSDMPVGKAKEFMLAVIQNGSLGSLSS